MQRTREDIQESIRRFLVPLIEEKEQDAGMSSRQSRKDTSAASPDVPFKTFSQSKTLSISSNKKAFYNPKGEAGTHSIYKGRAEFPAPPAQARTPTQCLLTPLPTLMLPFMNPCPLCDEAKEELAPYMDKFVLEQVDITLPENTAWYDRYKHDIPVFHLNGQFLMMHRVNIKKLERHLQKLEQKDAVS
ncbi:glutaredoxin-like protein C5orf63 homolog [Hyla sarda]|uniref:glutaredoxin-like protein C5orf63 homolog n=1 Tax=Hyla sarda TaxID=327740 RepID=UPI0024C297E5|nr:glutaredoxin-like protein C5orf63 homolog [Hyla sarda]